MNYTNLSVVLKYTTTTEEDFHTLLDQNPDDHHTRLVFADWLQDRDDPRAEGYRALGKLQKRPEPMADGGRHFFGNSAANHFYDNADTYSKSLLPEDWFNKIPHTLDLITSRPSNMWVYKESRREAEDAAAHAFSQLPPERREELLK